MRKLTALLSTKAVAGLVIIVVIAGLVIAAVVSNILTSPPADVVYGEFVNISWMSTDLGGGDVAPPTQFDITPDSTAETGDNQFYYIKVVSLTTPLTGTLGATWCSDTEALEIGDVTFFVETSSSAYVWEPGGGLDGPTTTDPIDFTTTGADFGDWSVDASGCITAEWDRYFRVFDDPENYRDILRFTTFARIGIPDAPLTLELFATAFN
jgi:hypothetical protein